MSTNNVSILKNSLGVLYTEIVANPQAKWGKMNAQQMIEHVADFFNVSTEKIKFELVTPEEHLPKYKEFLLSDKEFRENTKAPASVLGEEPLPLRSASIETAIDYLKKSAARFFSYFENEPQKKTTHPVFGPLNFEEWVMLHTKHVSHHSRQFQP